MFKANVLILDSSPGCVQANLSSVDSLGPKWKLVQSHNDVLRASNWSLPVSRRAKSHCSQGPDNKFTITCIYLRLQKIYETNFMTILWQAYDVIRIRWCKVTLHTEKTVLCESDAYLSFGQFIYLSTIYMYLSICVCLELADTFFQRLSSLSLI